ncbi:hypothetical protein A3SI_08506 [Nitritalea halalkaliphila LW7]|uniref:Uncharacterized protein n=1 Tax=Nitritalea halalkaliphila LW7 TaxID=1189621 RepID=I5C549_9BACT|nr:tetratricopeptide repeat protein [Nitritalea halalkaliphila]EIM76951.1 hypothetical protein A3SI_08506 [Nitritalea halalkaliphila LW7]
MHQQEEEAYIKSKNIKLVGIISQLLLLALLFFIAACNQQEDKKGRFLLKGNEKLKENDLRKAIDFYTEALAIDPNYRDALYNRALALERLRRFDEAIYDYGLILAANDQDYEVWFLRGLAHLDNGENYKALEDARAYYGRKVRPGKVIFYVGWRKKL